MIIPGVNQSVAVEGEVFHVQTEHHEAPDSCYIETQVYKEGRILLSRRFRQKAVAIDGMAGKLTQALRAIHLRVVEKIRDGALTKSAESSPGSSTRSLAELRDLRRLVVRLERAVGVGAPGEKVIERIRSVANALTVIAGKRLTPMLRQEDAAELLRYRDESMAIACAREPKRDAALDLWRRIAASACRLSRINSRRVLLEHDHACCRRLLACLSEKSEDERLDAESRGQLRQLWGRDARLDDLIDHPGNLVAATARTELHRLDDELSRRLEVPGTAPS